MNGGKRRGIVTGGTWCVDRNKIVSFWPQEDGLAECLSEVKDGGGSGCNLALDIRRLDPTMPVETIALVGDDEDGRFLQSLADAAKVDRRQMHVMKEAGTQAVDAFSSQATHRRTHIFSRGVADLLAPEHFDFAHTQARFLHLGLPGLHRKLDAPCGGDENGWVSILKRARAAGLKTNLELASIDVAQLAQLCRPCLGHLDMIIVNDTEIGAISGMTTVRECVTDMAACESAARSVMEKGAMEVVVVHCPAGAVAVTRDGNSTFKSSVTVPPELVVGTNGAGDAFAAGMLYGIHEGWTMDDSLSLAHATAAVSLRSVSTTKAVEGWQTCLDLANKWGWRE